MSDSNTVVVADGPVTVERDITVKPEGVIVEVSIRATEEATVKITDNFPAAVGPDEVGFHPEHTPETGDATTDQVTVETAVGPETPVTVVYGAYLDTSGLEVDWDESSLHVVAEPVKDIATANSGGGGGLRGYVNQFLGSGDEQPATADATEASTEPAAVEELDSFDATDDDAAEPTDDATSDGELNLDPAIDDELDDDATSDDATLTPAIRRVTEGDEASDEATDGKQDGTGVEATEEEHDMKETDAPTEREESGGIDATEGVETAEGSIAAALAAELEAGEVDQETQDILAAELGATLTGSQVTRLDHVQKRVDDIAAYMDPLEELLDAEGRPADVIRALREDVTDTREEIETLRETVETADDERSDLRAGLDDATAEIETVRTALDEELDALRTTLDEELERVEDAAREERRDIEADVEELEAIAGQMESLRDALSTAFGIQPATTTQSDLGEDAEPSTDATDQTEESTTEQAADGGDIESRLRAMEAEEPEREEPF